MEPATPQSQYDSEFFEGHLELSRSSARRILAPLFRRLTPRSVLDVGCGVGAWLDVAASLGATELVGLDGAWVQPDAILRREIDFRVVNLEQAIPEPLGRFELALCLEVAEHLPSARGSELVRFLCASSETVVFSAAIPGQGGTGHVNERSQSYWAELFRMNRFDVFDVIRLSVWEDADVAWWYRQNALVYCGQASPLRAALADCADRPPLPLDLVHPDLLLKHVNAYQRRIERPSFRFALRMFRRALRARLLSLRSRPRR